MPPDSKKGILCNNPSDFIFTEYLIQFRSLLDPKRGKFRNKSRDYFLISRLILGKCEKEKFTQGWKNFLARFDLTKGPFFDGAEELGFLDIGRVPKPRNFYEQKLDFC